MRTIGRKSLLWMTCGVMLTASGCGESPAPSTPALRLVERGLRREFNTRFIAVSERSPDTLLVAVGAGRLVRGVRGGFQVPSEQRAMIARRAIELLAPNPADRPAYLKWVVVEISDARRLGPIVFGRGAERSTHAVSSLFTATSDTVGAIGGTTLGGSLRPATTDSVR